MIASARSSRRASTGGTKRCFCSSVPSARIGRQRDAVAAEPDGGADRLARERSSPRRRRARARGRRRRRRTPRGSRCRAGPPRPPSRRARAGTRWPRPRRGRAARSRRSAKRRTCSRSAACSAVSWSGIGGCHEGSIRSTTDARTGELESPSCSSRAFAGLWLRRRCLRLRPEPRQPPQPPSPGAAEPAPRAPGRAGRRRRHVGRRGRGRGLGADGDLVRAASGTSSAVARRASEATTSVTQGAFGKHGASLRIAGGDHRLLAAAAERAARATKDGAWIPTFRRAFNAAFGPDFYPDYIAPPRAARRLQDPVPRRRDAALHPGGARATGSTRSRERDRRSRSRARALIEKMKRAIPRAPRRAADGCAAELRAGRLRDHARRGRRARGQGRRAAGVPLALRADGRAGRGDGRGAWPHDRRASTASGRSTSAASIATSFVDEAPERRARRRGARVGRAARPRSAGAEDVPGLRRHEGARRRRRGLPDDARCARAGGSSARWTASACRCAASTTASCSTSSRRRRSSCRSRTPTISTSPGARTRTGTGPGRSTRCRTSITPRCRARATCPSSTAIPDDLERYVLKPLFSFAGSGVKVDADARGHRRDPRAQSATGGSSRRRSPTSRRSRCPTGAGVKAEVRMMFLRAPDEPTPDARAEPRAALARQDARRRSEQGSRPGSAAASGSGRSTERSAIAAQSSRDHATHAPSAPRRRTRLRHQLRRRPSAELWPSHGRRDRRLASLRRRDDGADAASAGESR